MGILHIIIDVRDNLDTYLFPILLYGWYILSLTHRSNNNI